MIPSEDIMFINIFVKITITAKQTFVKKKDI